MQFQVPQFIDVEDKIFGPLTFKQFIYLVGGAGISLVLWAYLPSFVAILIIIPIAALSLSLAFYKINGKPFINTLESSARYAVSSKLYIWKKRVPEPKKESPSGEVSGAPLYVPKLSGSKLKDLSWSLDVENKIQ